MKVTIHINAETVKNVDFDRFNTCDRCGLQVEFAPYIFKFMH